MTESRLYVPFKNRQTLLSNSCDCTNRNAAFNLEKYGFCLDKIRAFFVSSLEYRIHSLLEEFVYSTNSQWAKQFPCFKKFVNAVTTWKDSNKVIEYDIGAMEKMMKNITKCVVKADLITCFLDSIILHHRLNKICRELNALDIEDNIFKSLNVWGFIERNYWVDGNSFTYVADSNNAVNYNTNSSMTSRDAKEQVRCKKTVEVLATHDVYCDRSTEHMQMSQYQTQEHRQILDSNRNFFRQKENNLNHSTYDTTGLQNNSTDKRSRSFNEKSCNTEGESKEIRSNTRLKIIIRKMCLDDYGHPTVSRSIVARLSVPCKMSNLIERIFEANPSLTESCLIVMKRKFEISMYNVCSCLNDVLGKLDIRFTKTLRLNCEIYPGYINLKLKTGGSSSVNKCLFVARIPICQNVRKHAFHQDISFRNSKSSIDIEKSKCTEQCKNDDNNFNDIPMCIDEESEQLDDTRCSQSDRDLVEDMVINVLQEKVKNSNEKEIICKITTNLSEYVQDLTIFSCKSCENINEEMSNVTLCIANSEEKSEKEYCEMLDSIEIEYDDNAEKHRKEILGSNNSIVKEDESIRLVNNANCMCSSYENLIEMNNKIDTILSNKNLDNFSQTLEVNEYDWTYSLDKESNLENKDCNINTYSIESFVQNSECDKQLVELNCNRFSYNDSKAVDKQLGTQVNNSSLNSAKVEIGCDSSSSYRHNDFIDITVVDNTSKENIVYTFEVFQDDFSAIKTQNNYSNTTKISSENNNSLTVSVQTPRLKISSKNINVGISCPRTVVWLASGIDRSISTTMKTRNRRHEIVDLSDLIVRKKENQILHDITKKVSNVSDRIYFIKSSERFLMFNGKRQLNGSSNNSSISMEEYLCMENHSTSDTSQYRRSLTSNSVTSHRRDEFQKFRKLRKLSKFLKRGRASALNGIHNVTSFTTIPRKRQNDSYFADVRSQAIFVMTKFHDSIDKSINRIKHLIRAKLERILFNNRDKTNMRKTFRQNKKSFEDTTREKINGRCIGQDYSITSCSISDCCKRSCVISSREFSNMILSIHRNQGKERSEKGMKFYHHRLAGDNEALSSLCSIKTSPWSYDLRTIISEKRQLGRNNNQRRYKRKEKIENNQSNINYNKNSSQYDFRSYGTSTTISSQSTKMSFIKNNSKHSERYIRKQQKEICDNKCVYKQMHNRDRRCGNKKIYQGVPIKYRLNINQIASDTSNESKMSLSYTWRRKTRNVHTQFRDSSKLKNMKDPPSRQNRQIFEKDTNISDLSNNNDRLCKRRAFAILTNACNDYMNDIDLNFKLKLLRYVGLCKSVKRLLIRTLRSDNIYEISTTSVPGSNLCYRL